MKVTRLHLENFRNHANSVLDCGDASFVVVRGRNFDGKSGIGQGLSMCATPSTTNLDPRGSGFATKIRRGTPKAVITTDFLDEGHQVQRTVTLSASASGRAQRTTCLDDPAWRTVFDKKLEDNRAALTVALNTDAFFRMDEKEQKNLLAALALPTRYDFDRDKVALVEKLLGQGQVDFNREPFAVIQSAYKKLFEERQVVNRQVREFYIPESLPVPGGLSSSMLEKQLEQCREDRRARMQERDRAVSNANKIEQGRSRIKARIDSINEAIEGELHRAEPLKQRLLASDRVASLRKVASGKEQWDKLIKAQSDNARLINQCRAEYDKLGIVPLGSKQCPTCNQLIDAIKVTDAKKRLADEIKLAEEADIQINNKIKMLGEVISACELIAAHDAAQKELEAIDSCVVEKRRLLGIAERELPQTEEFNFQPYDTPIAECDAQIEQLTQQLRPVIAAEERQKEIAAKEQQYAVLKEQAAQLDVLVKYFDKDGIKAELLAKYIGGFESKVNEMMGAWGYRCTLSIEPYSFHVTTARGDVVPVGELSGAERVMFSLAFQCAVSRTANLGLVVIDEVAMFLSEIRPAMNKRLYAMVKEGYLDQVILLIADASEELPKKVPPGAAFFMVTDGTVRRLKESAAAAA